MFKALIARKLEHCIKDEVQKKIPTGNIKAHQLKTLIIDQQGRHLCPQRDLQEIYCQVLQAVFIGLARIAFRWKVLCTGKFE